MPSASFPDSTFGSLSDAAAVDLLMTFADVLDPEAILLLEIGLLEDKSILLPGYDGQVITARFDLNLLNRINRKLVEDTPVCLATPSALG